MSTIIIEPELSRCVHTVAKDMYEDALQRLMGKESSNHVLQRRFSMLTSMLEQLDFANLRSQSEKYLVEGKKVQFIFCLNDNSLQYEMQILDRNE